MLFAREFTCRQAKTGDLSTILKCLKVFFVQQHLDWESIPDQVQNGKVALCYRDDELLGILSISGLQPDNQWVKIFAIKKESQKYILWKKLLSEAIQQQQIDSFYTIAYWDWYQKLVHQERNFKPFDEVVTLEKIGSFEFPYGSPNQPSNIRRLTLDDLDSIYSIDQSAFSPPWQLDIENLEAAIKHSKIGSVILQNDEIAGYLLCDPQGFSAHLSRIAISPKHLRKNLGSSLIFNLFGEVAKLQVPSLTVNTQASNIASLSLYRKFGFIPTGEQIPVFSYDCTDLPSANEPR